MDSRGRQLLQDTRRHIAESWCRGADARNAHGFEVDPWDEDAVSWSLLGAMVAVLEEEARVWGEIPLDDLAAAMYALSGLIATESLAEWNDDPQQTQEAVLAILDRAALAYVEPELLVQVSSN
jgi:beta-glucanase (GH16 family)